MPAGSKKVSIRKTGSGHRGRWGRYAEERRQCGYGDRENWQNGDERE